MKHRAIYLMAAAGMLFATPAFAAPVFMLQFGSFETREEADARLNEVKAQHSGMLGGLQSGVREVTLPPDNLVVYRTQAGPLETRAQAQAACSQLLSNGDECYVVETAMAPSFTPATTQTAQAAPASPSAAEPVNLAPIPARDPENVADINRVTAGKPTEVASAAPTGSPAMQQAMDNAAAEQSTREQQIDNAPTPPGAKKEGSFWSHLNPFSSDEAAAAPKAPPAPAPVAAPVADVDTSPVAAAAPAPSPALTPFTETPAAPPPVVMAAAPAPLPPPPAPLVGKGAIATTSTEASLRAPVALPEPTGNLNGPPPVVIADSANGNVRVGEAQRVPLTQNALPPAPAMIPAPAPAMLTPGAPAVSLHPNATLGQKTLWAHIGQFQDAQAALAFWDQYRRSHPDFPVVRVRVSSPMMALQRGDESVALRVGPFAKESSIRTLCSSLVPQQNLQCGQVTDMGIASAIGGGRSGYLSGSRYHR